MQQFMQATCPFPHHGVAFRIRLSALLFEAALVDDSRLAGPTFS